MHAESTGEFWRPRIKRRQKRSRRGLDTATWEDLFEAKIKAVEVKRHTGYEGPNWKRVIPSLRPWRYFLTDFTVSGAAPKNFIQVHDHDSPLRDYPLSWPAYIAKVGHKWYPAESLTEQLMTRLGETLGLRLASSRLMICDGQIRFLSRYFLQREESLVHGAEILAGYLEDEKFVAAVGEEKLEQDVFTFSVFCEAVRARFPANADDILIDFVRMIGFDAITGNQDRHLYNWGVIVHPTGLRRPRFSPIFDTARGLFWNEPESRLTRYDSDHSLRSYVIRAQPLVGWESEKQVNHFALVNRIAGHDQRYRSALSKLCPPGTLHRLEDFIDREFKAVFSAARRTLIKRCLAMRIELFREAAGKV